MPLKGRAWLEASMALMGVALGMSKDDIARAQEGNDIVGLDEVSRWIVPSFLLYSRTLLIHVHADTYTTC